MCIDICMHTYLCVCACVYEYMIFGIHDTLSFLSVTWESNQRQQKRRRYGRFWIWNNHEIISTRKNHRMQNRSGEVNLRFISNTMQNISLMSSMLLITAISIHFPFIQTYNTIPNRRLNKYSNLSSHIQHMMIYGNQLFVLIHAKGEVLSFNTL